MSTNFPDNPRIYQIRNTKYVYDKTAILSMLVFCTISEEIETIQQLIGYHPYNVQFWLMLMRAYKKLLADDSQSHVHADSEALPKDSVNIHNLDKKLENLTTGRSEMGEAQSVSDETKIKQQQSGDGIVEHLVKNCESSSGYDKISQDSSISSQILSLDCAHKPHICEAVEDTAEARHCEPPTSAQYKLLTCCIGARLVVYLYMPLLIITRALP